VFCTEDWANTQVGSVWQHLLRPHCTQFPFWVGLLQIEHNRSTNNKLC
jgi:hypothetical protein